MQTRSCSGISSVDVDEIFIDVHGFSTSLTEKITPSLTSDPDGPLHLSGSLLSRCCPACHRHPPSLHRLPVKCHFEDWIPDGHVQHWASNPCWTEDSWARSLLRLQLLVCKNGISWTSVSPHSPWSPAPAVGQKLTNESCRFHLYCKTRS